MKDASVLSGRGRATRAALLSALESELGRVGFDGTTSTAVAAAAGVSTGTFYGYFADKHAALAALFAHRLDELVDAVDGVLTADNLLDLGLEATMRLAVDRVVAAYRSHAGALRSALAQIPADARLRAVYWERHERAVAVAVRFVERGVAAGLIRAEPPARVLAQALLVLTQALHHPVVTSPEDPALVEPLAREVARALTALLAREAR
jgi:AcrR family transcriptional regulator